MPRGLKRRYGRGDLHFLTFSCYQRLEFLATKPARNLFVSELARVRREYGFRLVGYVVMPNPVHLLVGEPSKGTVSTVLQMLKQQVARKMLKKKRSREGQLALAFEQRMPRAFWHARLYDFSVYSRGKVQEKLNCMHANPVIRGLVKHPKDWVWSSWARYTKGEAV